jgi:ornithine cyclodeaminase
LISQADILGELAELVPGPAQIRGRHSDQDITVFKSVGFAALDLIAAEHLFQPHAGGSV